MNLIDLYKNLLGKMLNDPLSRFICVNIPLSTDSEEDSDKLYEDFTKRKQQAREKYPESWIGGDAWWLMNEIGNSNRINFLKDIIKELEDQK